MTRNWSLVPRFCLLIGLAAALGAAGCDGGGNEDAGTDGMVTGDAGPGGDAAFTITPALQNFGDLAVGASSSAAAFTVTNTGMSASGAVTTAISGAGATSYSITANTCAGMTLAPAATCMISVVFSPTQLGSLTGAGHPGGGHGDRERGGRGPRRRGRRPDDLADPVRLRADRRRDPDRGDHVHRAQQR